MMAQGRGIVLSGADKTIESRAKNLKMAVTVDKHMPLLYDRTLFVEAGTEVPWDLLPAAWNFLERWDAAVPLWRYGACAGDVGSKAERERTAAVVRDLRVLLYSVELLFVRDNADGRALVDAYLEEQAEGGEKRLAFLRAYYRTKPRLCVLPVTWLAKVFERSKMEQAGLVGRGGRRRTGQKLVSVEIAPGRFVKCNPGDEEQVLAQAERVKGRRRR